MYYWNANLFYSVYALAVCRFLWKYIGFQYNILIRGIAFMTKGEIAKKNYESGMNCAQAVALAFQEETGLSESTLKKLIIGFGGGFGRQGLVCGAVCGMTMILSYLKTDGVDKMKAYALIKDACESVKQKLGSIVCAELLADKKVPCGEICQIVADITQDFLNR